MRVAGFLVVPLAAGLALAGIAGAAFAHRAATGPTAIVQGVVQGSAKAPLGPTVVLLYLPSPIAPAGPSKNPLLASGTTDEKGGFSLSVSATPFLQKLAAANGGWLNLDLLVVGKDLYLYRSLPRRFDPTLKTWQGVAEINSASVDVGSLLLSLNQPGVAKRTGKVTPTPIARRADAAALTCADTTASTRGFKIPTTVGELHNVSASARFAYGHPASSTIDVAMAPGLSGSGWSLVPGAGSTSVVANLGPAPVTVSTAAAYDRSLNSTFLYQERLVFNACSGYRRVVKAVQWQGGLSLGKGADPSAHCTLPPFNGSPRRESYPAGGNLTRNSSIAYRFPRAANVSAATGSLLWLSARSGFSPSVWEQWSFSSPGVLCGDTGAPGASQRIFAGS